MKLKLKVKDSNDLPLAVKDFIVDQFKKFKQYIKLYTELDKRLDVLGNIGCSCTFIICDRCRLVRSYNQELNQMEK